MILIILIIATSNVTMFSCSRLTRAAPSWPWTGLALPSGVFLSPFPFPFLSFVLLRFHRYKAPTPRTIGVPTNSASCQRGSPLPDCGSTGFEAAIIHYATISQQVCYPHHHQIPLPLLPVHSEVTVETQRIHGIVADAAKMQPGYGLPLCSPVTRL